MKLLRILLLAISLTTTLFARAYDFEANGLYFDFVSTGDLTCALAEGPSPYTGALVIPDEVEYSGKKLKVIEVSCQLKEISSVQFGKNVTKICSVCFYGNQQITSITLPSTLKKIGDYAFSKCTSLTSVKWEGDMILSPYIFSECTKLKNLSYKSICKDIPQYSFYECSSLTSLDLSEVEKIGRKAFYGCKSLNKFNLSSIKEIYDSNTFDDCGEISLVIIGGDIETFGSTNSDNYVISSWNYCNIDSLVLLPSDKQLKLYLPNATVKGLYLGRVTCKGIFNGGYLISAFNEMSSLKSVRIGDSVLELPTFTRNAYKGEYDGYFEDCQNLEQVIFDGNEITIGRECFKGTNIKEVNLPKGKNVISYASFPACVSSISFGSDVTINGAPLGSGELSLKRISFLDPTPDKGYTYYFDNMTYTSAKLFVPYGSKEAYQNTEPWKNFWNIEEMPGVATERVEITPTNTKIQVGDSLQLTGTRYPENSVDPIQWKSSDIKIATVSDAGLVKAVAPGKVTITATSGKASATCEVTVSPVTAQKIILSKDKVSINESDTVKIIATVQPENTTDKTITWSSSNEKIATVSKDGIIKAIKVGTATITAACGEVKATCEVTVLPITAEKIVLDLTEVSLNQSDTIKITATITPENTTDKTITWSSSDEKIATVSTDGIITAVGVGKATITASCGDIAATCEVTVLEPNIGTDFADNKLTIMVEGSGKPVEISIYSVMGQRIFQKTVEGAVTVKDEIDLSSLSAGTYIVQIISGEMNTSKRIVK